MPFESVDFSKTDIGVDGIDSLRARTADPKGHRRAAGVAAAGARASRRRAASGRRARPLHRLRDLVPRRPRDRRARRAGARGRARERARRGRARRARATRGRRGSRRRPWSAFAGETWLVTGAAESPLARLVDRVVVVTPEIEKSYCHTASYTAAVAAGRALLGEDVRGFADGVEAQLAAEPFPVSDHERFLVVGAGGDVATVLEAVLKLREGVHVAAEAHHTEQLLHGHLAGSTRGPVLRARGRGPRGRARRATLSRRWPSSAATRRSSRPRTRCRTSSSSSG